MVRAKRENPAEVLENKIRAAISSFYLDPDAADFSEADALGVVDRVLADVRSGVSERLRELEGS